MTTETSTATDNGVKLHEEIQRVVHSLAERDVYTTCDEMVTTLIGSTHIDPEGGPSLPTADDLAPVMSRPDYSEAPEGYRILGDNEGSGWNWFKEDEEPENWADIAEFDTERETIEAAWEDSGDEPPHEEALQFWLVSSQLAEELEAHGACVARDVLGFNVWGRTECGSALEDDSDLLTVAAAMVLRIHR